MTRTQPRRVLVRVDASESIGTGHAVRCIALSRELASRDMEPWFASRPGSGDQPDQVAASGSTVIRIDGPPTAEVAAILRNVPRVVRRRPFAALVMDHYSLGADWLSAARPLATRRLVIDDLADRPLPCELLVNSNLGVAPDDYGGLVRPGTVMLLGVRYLLLRPAFRTAKTADRRPAGMVERVVVSMGGSDPSHVTAVAVTAVRSALPTARIDVILGALYRGQRRFGPGVRVHQAIGEGAIAQLMARADMAVGAGGTSAWERCAIGLPTVIIRLAPNQDEVAGRLDAAGAAVDAGSANKLEIATLSGLIGQLANDQARREAMSEHARTLVDGRGTERVAHHLDGVRVRRASMSDARLLWQWANDPETRSASFRTERIPYRRPRGLVEGPAV